MQARPAASPPVEVVAGRDSDELDDVAAVDTGQAKKLSPPEQFWRSPRMAIRTTEKTDPHKTRELLIQAGSLRSRSIGKGETMPKVHIDMPATFDAPDGDYPLMVDGVSTFTTRDGKTGILIRFLIREGESEGVVVLDTLYATAKAAWRIAKFYRAMGQEVPKGAVDLDTDEWIERTVKAKIHHTDWNGEEVLTVADYFKPGESSPDGSPF